MFYLWQAEWSPSSTAAHLEVMRTTFDTLAKVDHLHTFDWHASIGKPFAWFVVNAPYYLVHERVESDHEDAEDNDSTAAAVRPDSISTRAQ
jgi:hypothetical protein